MKLIRALCAAAALAVGSLALTLVPPALASPAAAASPALTSPAAPASATARPVFNVLDYGAATDGTTNDTPAINAAITAANAAGPDGGVVEFPAGTYLAGGSIHLLSNITIQLDAGATITAAATGFDPPEPNPYDQYQDYGHSHFHDSVIWGENLTNVAFTGSGTITGAGHLITGTPNPGQADKLLTLVNVNGLILSGITLDLGGHIALLTQHCTHVVSDHLTISTAADRDGWNVVDTTDVRISNINVSSNDDSLVFKADYALGQVYNSGNVVVNNAQLSSKCCNAVMFGSETCGNFTNYTFNHILVTEAGKSGLGIVSEDGAHISDVTYNNVVMSNTQSPIMEKIGTRLRCGGSPTIGSISGIHYNDVTGTSAGAFSPTLWGQPGHPVSDITFNDVHLTLPGGIGPMDPNAVPTDNGDYNPNSLGTRPAYGFYLHNVTGITFNDASLQLAADDGRPALIANDASNITLRGVRVQAGSDSPFDLGFQDVTRYCLVGTRTLAGGVPRLSTEGSRSAGPGCTAGLDNFSLSAAPATATVAAGSATTVTLGTAVTAGRPGPVTLTATSPQAGIGVSLSRASVRPGQSASLTVTVAAGARNGTYQIPVMATDATATQYATITVTVTGGVTLAITGLSVADTANAASWSVQSNLQPGDQLYGDRTIAVASVPAALTGAAWIRTANSSKSATESPLVTFTINTPATVAVAVDTRLARLPWLDSTWTDSGLQITDNEGTPRTFEVYTKTFPAGTVTLGPQADLTNGSSMYTIAVY
ncbi:MAG TPA: glycosyl hydrolase family 28 protein [Trebonia sp.]|nr:glycosyl hydrolase family 28 protein [Trebonia sp.]